MRSWPVEPGLPSGDRRAVAVFSAGLALIFAAFALFSDPLGFFRTAVGAWTALAMLWGVHVFRPVRPVTWYLLTAATFAFMASNATPFTATVGTAAGLNDWTGLFGYPLAAASLMIMIRSRLVRTGPGGLLDAIIAVGAVTFVAWVYLIVPYVREDALSWGFRLVAIAFPVGDLVLLALVARLMTARAARTTSLWLLTAGLAALLVSDVNETLLRLGTRSWANFGWDRPTLDAGWIAFCACWGLAALHPSMRDDTRPARATADVLPPARLAAFAVAAVITPTVVFIQLLRKDESTGWFGPLLSGSVFLAVLARISLVLAEHRRAIERERILLETSASLLATDSVDGTAATLTSAATRLLGHRRRHKVVVGIGTGFDMHVASAGIASAPAARGRTGLDTTAWREVLSMLDSFGPADGGRSAVLLPADALPEPVADRLAGLGHVLFLPLGLESLPTAPGSTGFLAAASDETHLIALRGSLEILAGQAALTLKRVEYAREIARRDGEAYFRVLAQNTTDAVLIVDSRLRVTYASPSAELLFNRPRLVGTGLAELVGAPQAADVANVWADRAAAGDPPRRDWTVPKPSGEQQTVEVSGADLRDEPTVRGFVLTLHDVTTAHGLEKMLHRHAYFDELTGLPNRLAFGERVREALDRAAPGTSVLVALLDIDRFREINDVHGRAEGDCVLLMVREEIRAWLLPGDFLARTGGDEFALLRVVHPTDPALAGSGTPGQRGADHAQSIIDWAGRMFPLWYGAVQVSASGSVAVNRPGCTGASMLADAELALHAANAAGNGAGTWRRYDPSLRTAVAARAALEQGLDIALLEEALILHYQPIVNLADGTVAGFESLIRWPRADGSTTMPDDFIPMAEATGQILPLGRWILRQATADAAEFNRFRAAGSDPLKVTVNIAAQQLCDPAFPDLVTAALAAAGLPPELLVLEATESSLIQCADAARANLTALTTLGVRLALDDFGTGYSSLSYLRDLPVTSLKIDKLFVTGITESPRQAALVRGIIGIADSLGLQVIAEGIETGAQRAALLALGAGFGQGYLFARPMPFADAVAVLTGAVGPEASAPAAPWLGTPDIGTPGTEPVG